MPRPDGCCRLACACLWMCEAWTSACPQRPFPEAGANRGVDQQVVPDAQYLVALMTPAILPELVIGQPVPGLPGNLVGAVVSGITSTAGFERSDAQVRKLTASRAVIPAGAVFFMEEATPGEALPESIGDRTWRGYGRFRAGGM